MTRLQREILGATRERMVREICEALELLTREAPTGADSGRSALGGPIDAGPDFGAGAPPRTSCKLLLLGTYRPVDVILLQSPLKVLRQDLVMHKLCFEIALERLTEPRCRSVIWPQNFPGIPGGLAELVHRHSEGNPLFMTAIVSDLVKSGLLVEGRRILAADRSTARRLCPDVPETLQQMLEIQVERLSEPEQRVLKSASVAGRRFSAWSVAAMLDSGVAETEDICDSLRAAPAIPAAGQGGWSAGRDPIRALRISAFALSGGVVPPNTRGAARALASAACGTAESCARFELDWPRPTPRWNWPPNWLCTSSMGAISSARRAI